MKTKLGVALGVTTVLTLAVCGLSGAQVLVAADRPALALRLPYGAAAVARAGFDAQGPVPVGEVARAALRISPLVEPAVAALGRGPAGQAASGAGRSARFTALAGRLGWRDAAVQRQLYNTAAFSGDYAGAMSHADAIMRVSGQHADLDSSLSVAANVPAVRSTMLPYFRQHSPWARRWLVLSARALSDEAVVDLAKALLVRPDEDIQASVAQIMWGLVQQGRVAAALQIDAVVRGAPVGLPMVLAWPEQTGNPPGPFAWQLGKGYAIAPGALKRLVADEADGMALTYRLLTLPPGNYAMTLGKRQAAMGTWKWAMGCGNRPLAVGWNLERSNEFSVDEECPLQWIALRGDLTAPPLDAMTIAPLAQPLDDEQP